MTPPLLPDGSVVDASGKVLGIVKNSPEEIAIWRVNAHTRLCACRGRLDRCQNPERLREEAVGQ